MEPPINATLFFCRQLGIRSRSNELYSLLQHHPDYPSLLSVSDTLRHVGIENFAIKADFQQMLEVKTPFIALLSDVKNGNYFGVVTQVAHEEVTFLDTNSALRKRVSITYFSRLYCGTVLVAGQIDVNARKNLDKEKNKRFTQILKVALIMISLLVALTYAYTFIKYGLKVAAFPVLYNFLSVAGTIISTLLVMLEINQHHSALRKVCKIGRKTNCAALLNSSFSRVAGTSWSVIGFTFFAALFLIQFAVGIVNLQILNIFAYLSTAAGLYVFYSMYIQWKVVGQWCPLCLATQSILLGQLTIVFFANFFNDGTSNIDIRDLLFIAFAVLTLLLAAHVFVTMSKRSMQYQLQAKNLAMLKKDTRLFRELLERQENIDVPDEGLGITIGNAAGNIKIIKVCQPYCQPCSLAHPLLKQMVETNLNVRLQYIFANAGRPGNAGNAVITHLLGIASIKDENMTKAAIDDWFQDPSKDYRRFVEKYPLSGELEIHDDEITKSMATWCEQAKISHTPTIFINGKRLPEIYEIEDLSNLLTESTKLNSS